MLKRTLLILAIVALMAAMMLSGPAAMAKHSNHGKHKAQGDHRVTLCFHGHTINVASPAKQALLNAGATEGACS